MSAAKSTRAKTARHVEWKDREGEHVAWEQGEGFSIEYRWWHHMLKDVPT